MNTIYLPIEIKSREFVSRLLIALETAKIKPCEIFIGYKGDVNFYAKNFNPGIYYGLSSTENLENLYLDIKRNGNLIAISDEESMLTFNDNFHLRYKVSKKIMKIADLIFSPGVKNMNSLKKIISDKKIFCVGNPRLDLLKKPINKIYQNEVNTIKKKYNNFILICTSFGRINFFSENYDALKDLKKKKIIKSNKDLKLWKEFLNYKSIIFNDFLELFEKIENLKDLNFVIRSHPSENMSKYKKICQNKINLFFDNSFSVHPWILASKGIINHYCTTTFEGLIANKEIYTIKKKKIPDLENIDFYSDINCFRNYQEIIRYFVDKKQILRNKSKSKIKKYLKNLDVNLLSYKEIAKILAKNQFKKQKNNLIFFYLKLLKNKIYNIKNFFFEKQTNLYVNHKIQNITEHEIYEIINYFQEYKNIFKVKKISKNFFKIKRIS